MIDDALNKHLASRYDGRLYLDYLWASICADRVAVQTSDYLMILQGVPGAHEGLDAKIERESAARKRKREAFNRMVAAGPVED